MTTLFLLTFGASAIAYFGAVLHQLVRERREHHRRSSGQLVALRSVERVAKVRAAAEAAALQVALGWPAAANPYPSATREYVLWMTSFHARLMELETEAFAPRPAVPAAALLP